MNVVAMDAMSMEEFMSIGHDDLHDDHMADNKFEAYGDVFSEPLIPGLVRARILEDDEGLRARHD